MYTVSIHKSNSYVTLKVLYVEYTVMYTVSLITVIILHDNGIILPYIAEGEFKMQPKPSAELNLKLELS